MRAGGRNRALERGPELALDPCEQPWSSLVAVGVQKPFESYTLESWQLPTPGPYLCFLISEMQIRAQDSSSAILNSQPPKR